MRGKKGKEKVKRRHFLLMQTNTCKILKNWKDKQMIKKIYKVLSFGKTILAVKYTNKSAKLSDEW